MIVDIEGIKPYCNIIMKKNIIVSLLLLFPCCISAQELLTIKQCREMALQNNKQMASSVKQTLEAEYTRKSFKANFFPNFSAYATDLYTSMDSHLN